jgi:hypothetical protein
VVGNAIVTNAVTESIMTWHKHLGHKSKQGLKVLLDCSLIMGLKYVDSDFREDCMFRKHHRTSFTSVTIKSKNVLYLIHSNTWESFEESVGGLNCFIYFVNDFSRKVWVYILKRKSNAFSCFKNFKALVENQTGRRLSV